MSIDPIVPGTGLSCVTDRKWSLRLYYQRVNTHVNEAKHLDGIWSNSQLTVEPIDGSPLASVMYRGGTEIRLYYLDPSHVVQEFCYTEGKGWYQGGINKTNAKANPGGGLAAVVYGDNNDGIHLRVYYQDYDSHVVKELANDGSWHSGDLNLTGALRGTNLAAVTYNLNNQTQIRLYYQAEDLSLKEHGHNNSGWFSGGFAAVGATPRTPICALAFSTVELQVYWRRIDGHTLFSRNTGSWSNPATIEAVGPSHNFTALQWDNGKLIRLYHQDLSGALAELYSDDAGQTWHRGSLKV